MSAGLRDLYDEQDNPANVWELIQRKFAFTIMAQKARVRKEWLELGVNACSGLNEYEARLNNLKKRMRLCGYASEVTEVECVS